MNSTDILLSIAIVGVYTQIYIYLKTRHKNNSSMIKLFAEGFIIATAIFPSNLKTILIKSG